MPKLSAVSKSPLFEALCLSVATETASVTFACGGKIPMASNASGDGSQDQAAPRLQANPVTLRWDAQDGSISVKMTLPLTLATEGDVEQLIKDMQPATFGRGGEHVFDTSYRRASKLDPTKFTSSFNPYELGIIDTVAQALLPSLRGGKQVRGVYSGPSGKFKSHVDTPRSPDQFGSLVVCLPLDHQGGALEVRHKEKTVVFDWSKAKGDKDFVHWAAFYSDCEHEVLEVTQGHRLTLTYNLYCVRGNGQLGGHCRALDPTKLPLYKTIYDLVSDRNLWAEGGLIGYNCSHVYPHTTKTPINFTAPDNLKGADMLMFEMFSSMGLRVRFRPAVLDPQYRDYSMYLHGSGDSSTDNEDNDDKDDNDDNDDDMERGALGKPVIGKELGYKFELGLGFEPLEAMKMYDKWSGKTEGAKYVHFDTDEEALEMHAKRPREAAVDQNQNQALSEYIKFSKVHWLNDASHMEPQLSWIAYGNEPSIKLIYSSLAMIIDVPAGGAQHSNNVDSDEKTDRKRPKHSSEDKTGKNKAKHSSNDESGEEMG